MNSCPLKQDICLELLFKTQTHPNIEHLYKIHRYWKKSRIKPKNVVLLPAFLFYQHFHSYELHSLVPTVRTFTTKTSHATYAWRKYIYYLLTLLVKRMFHSDSFYPMTSILWNRHPIGYFLDPYNLDNFTSVINPYHV